VLTFVRSLRFASLILLAHVFIYAQVVGGSIGGLVTDSTGAGIRDAVVVIRNTETGTARSLVTGGDGRYSAPSLAVGRYDVTVTSAGFGSQQRSGVVLTVGQSDEVDVVLLPGSVAQDVVVDGAPDTINLSTEQTSGLVDSRQIKELPLNGRSYDQLITLNPGTVNYTGQRSGGVGTSNSSVGNMFAVSGRRPQDNLFLLNGVEYTGASLINVTPGGTSGQLLGIDAVREFNVVSDTYSAAYGKRDGAQISIVTSSGSNQLHGDVYEFVRNSFFDARNYFDLARIPEFQRNNYGAALGGPIRRDKFFLFGNYESFRQNLGLSLVTLVPDNQGFLPNAKGVETPAAVSPISKQLLKLWPVQNGPEVLNNGLLTGIAQSFNTAQQHIREDFGTTRFDANLTANDLLFAVYTIDDSTAHTPTQDPLSVVDESLREQVVSVQEQHIFSARLLNTTRVGFSRASFLFLGSVPSEIQAVTPTFVQGKPTGAIVIAGSTASNGASSITTAGVNVGANNAITRNLYTFDDHVFYTVGKHQIEAGVWVQRLQSNDNLAQDQYGQASFASLSTFLAGTPIKTFTYAPNPTPLGWRSLFGAGYVEDTFRLSPRVEIRAGFRTESTSGWSEAQGQAGVYTFTNNVINSTPVVQSNALTDNRALFLFEPRVGLAWNVFANGGTSVRIGAGLHHSLLDALDYRLDQAAPFNTVYSYANSAVANPTGVTPLVSPSTVATDIATPSLLSYSLRIEQQIARSTSLTVGYSGSHSTHQILSGDLNEPAYTIVGNGRIYYPTTNKANPAVANTTSWWSGGSGNYNAFIVDLRHDLSRGIQFRANYTWSKNLDDGSAWNTSVSANTPAFVAVPSLPHLDYGPAATDVRHLVAINGTYDLPFGNGKTYFPSASRVVGHVISGWSLSTIAALQTGFPFSPQLGYNPTGSGDSRNPVRPDMNPNFNGSLYSHGNTAARAAQYFNPNAFSAPAYGTVGNAPRDGLTGPGYVDWDVSLLKATQLSESVRLQFRAEFFNVLNHTNLQLPNEVVFSAGPTQGTVANQTAAVSLGSPGVITATANTSRQIQLGAKLIF
jgi:Carboxypeptidase regulatory-like domain